MRKVDPHTEGRRLPSHTFDYRATSCHAKPHALGLPVEGKETMAVTYEQIGAYHAKLSEHGERDILRLEEEAR